MTVVAGSEEAVMNTNVGFSRSLAVAIIGVATLGLLACSNSNDQSPPAAKVSEAPATAAQPVAAAEATPGGATKEQALPDTTSTDAKSPDPSRPMTKKEESTAMPLPGQANDHSNPTTGPAKPPTS